MLIYCTYNSSNAYQEYLKSFYHSVGCRKLEFIFKVEYMGYYVQLYQLYWHQYLYTFCNIIREFNGILFESHYSMCVFIKIYWEKMS